MKHRFLRSTLLGLVLVAATVGSASAATWNIDPAHSVLTFKVRHLFSNTKGEFGQWGGTLEFDPAKLKDGSAEIRIEVASIDTDNDDRDNHLRSADFFDAETYPEITFVSKKVTKKGDEMHLVGDLTIRGVTKEVAIPFEFHGSGADPWGNTRAGFSGELKIDRKDFGVNWNKALDKGGFVLGDEVNIDIEIEAVQSQEG